MSDAGKVTSAIRPNVTEGDYHLMRRWRRMLVTFVVLDVVFFAFCAASGIYFLEMLRAGNMTVVVPCIQIILAITSAVEFVRDWSSLVEANKMVKVIGWVLEADEYAKRAAREPTSISELTRT